MLLKKDNSCLLLIDAQEKLIHHINQSEAVIARCEWLMQLATQLDVPQIISEQYPQGLGHTIAPLTAVIPTHAPIDKVHFSCWREPRFKTQLEAINRKQLVLIGIEAHVCVLQSAMDLLAAGFEVFVVVDAVGSRHELDYKYGLKRMKQAGIQLVTAEMVFFEWLEHSKIPGFKELSKQFLQ